ncbi:uncharacterized protein LOC143148404 [Ptiloglossa arizonensis]|uniref:uncharacterized protein LOC143148404 n=1 Tax=Ptiloglossa arizonensis TaxID=3350558 RepID=UPI003FA14E45
MDGQHLGPIEIDVTANIIKPQLVFNIPKYDRTFTCSVTDVIQRRWKPLVLKKTFYFYNNDSNLINVSFETFHPFYIDSISIYAETNPCKIIRDVCISDHGCAEVVVSCIIQEDLIETLLNTNKSQDLQNTVVTLKELLLIIHTDNSTQV